MVLDKNLTSFLLPSFADQPSGAFGHNEDGQKLDTRHETLQSGGENPLYVSSLVPQGSKAYPGSDDAPEIPKRVINCRDLASMSGMGDLGDEERASSIGNVRATAHNKSADEI
jgi:hypothetical protein